MGFHFIHECPIGRLCVRACVSVCAVFDMMIQLILILAKTKINISDTKSNQFPNKHTKNQIKYTFTHTHTHTQIIFFGLIHHLRALEILIKIKITLQTLSSVTMIGRSNVKCLNKWTRYVLVCKRFCTMNWTSRFDDVVGVKFQHTL